MRQCDITACPTYLQVANEAMAHALSLFRRLLRVNHPVALRNECFLWGTRRFETGGCLMSIRWAEAIKVGWMVGRSWLVVVGRGWLVVGRGD